MKKAKLLSTPSKLTFVNNDLAKTFSCLACGDLAIYHYFATCKHVLCGKCHSIFHHKPCPIKDCTNKMIEEIFQDMEFETGINNLLVHCTHQIYGCTETVPLFKLLDHQTKCKFSIKNLLPKLWKPPTKSKYDEKLEEEIEKLTKTVAEIESRREIKDSEFLKKMLAVESLAGKWPGISEEVSKLSQTLKSISAEMDTLRNEIIKLVDGKVEDIIERQAVKRSLQDQKIEKMKSNMKEEMSKIQEKHAKSEETIMQLVGQTISTQIKKQDIEEATSTSFDWTISGIRQILKDWKDGIMREVLGDAFKTKDFGYAMRCKLVYRAKQKSFSILFHFDPNVPKSAPAVYHHQRSFAILDQSRFGEKHIWRLDSPGFGSTQAKEWMTGYHNDSWLIPLEVLGAKSPYILNDVIVARILIEPMAMVYKSVFSRNGTLIWKLDRYNRRKQDYIDGVTKFLRSPCFYTHEQGYRVHLGLHARSYDMSFYLSFNKGEFDDFLPSTFPHQATLVIMPQLGQHEHQSLIHSQKSSDTTSNLIAMIPTKVIESPEYLQDDSILIKLTVE